MPCENQNARTHQECYLESGKRSEVYGVSLYVGKFTNHIYHNRYKLNEPNYLFKLKITRFLSFEHANVAWANHSCVVYCYIGLIPVRPVIQSMLRQHSILFGRSNITFHSEYFYLFFLPWEYPWNHRHWLAEIFVLKGKPRGYPALVFLYIYQREVAPILFPILCRQEINFLSVHGSCLLPEPSGNCLC